MEMAYDSTIASGGDGVGAGLPLSHRKFWPLKRCCGGGPTAVRSGLATLPSVWPSHPIVLL